MVYNMVLRLAAATLLIVLATVILSGCSQLQRVADEGADQVIMVNDAKLTNYEQLYCDAPSTGAVVREYGRDPDLWNSYWGHCNKVRAKYQNEVPVDKQ